ncbi:MAG: polyprenyl synthetase family protein, partial [Flavobacteriaceae bacterium]
DYLLSKGLLLCIDHDDFDLLKIISVAVRSMSEGELLQIEKARRLDIDEGVYLEIIKQKTATLIASCCAIGAQSVYADKEEVDRMWAFGEALGMAFQIKDDLFDYGEAQIGKPLGIDIKERKMTLPLIHALNVADGSQRRWLLNSIKNHNKDKKRVREVIALVKSLGGLDYATTKMHQYQKQALEILSTYPDSPAKDSLRLMIDYVIERKK